jgi:hypothetical protein
VTYLYDLEDNPSMIKLGSLRSNGKLWFIEDIVFGYYPDFPDVYWAMGEFGCCSGPSLPNCIDKITRM